LLAAEAAKSADSKRKAQQGKILQKRGAAAPASAGCPLDAFCVQRNENRIARSRVPRAEREQASQLSKQTELCLRKRASSEISAIRQVPNCRIQKFRKINFEVHSQILKETRQMLANDWVAEGGRAKFATGRFLLFKRIPIFFASNFSETAWTTSTCSFDVFSEEDSNSIIRKTVQRTNILLSSSSSSWLRLLLFFLAPPLLLSSSSS